MEENTTVERQIIAPGDALESSVGGLTKNLLEMFGEEGIYNAFASILGYEDVPPTIQQFLDDDDWLGKDAGSRVYLPWRNALFDIYPNPFQSPYNEIIVTGSIGTGKTTVGILGCIYDLIRFAMLRNPQEQFGLMPTTKIAYAILNVTLHLAGNVIYDQVLGLMQGSPKIKQMLSKSSGRTILPKGIDVFTGSRPSHALGMAIVGAILDEINFQHKVVDQAYENYNAVKARIKSRFLQTDGSFPSRVWLLSSKRGETDFLDGHIKKHLHTRTTKIYDYPIWEVLKHKPNMKYSGENFSVFIGDGNRDPQILNSTIGYPDERIIQVPVEYRQEFEYDPYVALRDLAGMSIRSVFRYISSDKMIARSLILPNPVYRNDPIMLDFEDRTDKLIDYVKVDSVMIPQYRHAQRFIHVDLAVNGDRLGMASTLISDVVDREKIDPATGLITKVMEPRFVTEFVIAIQAKASSQIPFYKIKEFIYMLHRDGYPISKVTFDGFQSVNLIQDLTMMGINAEILSVDRKKDPYDTLKDALLTGRWMAPKNDILEKELKGLVDTPKCIDHTRDGSKDISDSCAGSLYSAYQSYAQYPGAYSLQQHVRDSYDEVHFIE